MGCGPSADAATAARRNRPKMEGGQSRAAQNQAQNNMSPVQRFDSIVNGAKMIAAPSNMMPIVCLSRDAFPIITSFLHLEDSTPTEIQLPIIAGSIYGNGRIIAFAQQHFLSSKVLHTADTSKIVINSLNWVSGGFSSMTNVCMLGYQKNAIGSVQKALQELGFFAETANSRTQFGNYRALVIPSDITLDDDLLQKIVEYVHNGGGLAVFYKHGDVAQLAMPINKLLAIFGISFTYCLLNEDLEDADNIQVPPSFTYVRDSNFVPISAHFKAIVKQNNIDTSTLDDLVTTLRYYIMVCDDTYSEQLQDIASYSWDFLKRTNYSTEEGICPDIKHGIVVVLLQDLYAKLPMSKIEAIPEHAEFPGDTGEVEMGSFTMTLRVQDETWTSTGLWLPAGIVGSVECSDETVTNVNVQIGSHHESLLTQQGPWKRWPSVVSAVPLEKSTVEVGTPFGGMVYITVNSLEPTEPRDVEFTFNNFCRYPRYVHDQPEIWEETKDIDVPWGEIDVGSIIFTLPSEEMRKITDFDKLKKHYDTIISSISNYMSYQTDKPYRIVFDVELADEGPGYGYPLVLHVNDIPGVLHDLQTPKLQLFKAISLMTIVSIREECFDVTTETAIATVATAVVFQELYRDFNPFDFPGLQLPTLFQELWEIHTNYSADLIPQTLEKFQNPDYPVLDVPEDMWIAFVREMCRLGKRDFTKLLERSRPIPLNISISLQGLPPYQPN